MTTMPQSIEYRLIQEVADRYIRQGYPVQIQPLEEDLPDFLKRFKPDLIVITPEGHIVVEVKSTNKNRNLEFWQELKEAVEAHPGWRFQFVVNNRSAEELVNSAQAILSTPEIEDRLIASQQLADKGLLDSALVVAWSTLEAVLREASRTEGLTLPNQGPGTLITALYSEGDLEHEDYETLMRILPIRNQAVHGFRIENMDRALIDQVQEVTRRRLSQQLRAA